MKIINASNIEYYKKDISAKSEKKQVSNENKTEKSKNIKVTDKVDISILKEEAEKVYAHLKQIVSDLLERQGYSIEQLGELKAEDIKVDQKARDEAAQMIEEGGPLSPENVSNRILDFAKSISGGDKSKFELIKGAIKEGFEQAKKALGGELPEISQKTYDLIQKKLEDWNKE